jgi:uncharacterized RmlC-like cupin family protein
MKITSRATSRKLAIYHISGQVSPLIKVITQIYLFGNTQTLSHWKKELAAIIHVVSANVDVKGGKRLKASDIVEALDNATLPRLIKSTLQMYLTDDDYKTLVPRSNLPFRSSLVMQLLTTLVDRVLGGDDPRSIAEALTEEILIW